MSEAQDAETEVKGTGFLSPVEPPAIHISTRSSDYRKLGGARDQICL